MYRPDLNPIEHRWDQLKRRVRRRNLVPSTREELRIAAAREEWNVVPQGHIQSLLSSTQRWMQAVISLPEDMFFGKVHESDQNSIMEARSTKLCLWRSWRTICQLQCHNRVSEVALVGKDAPNSRLLNELLVTCISKTSCKKCSYLCAVTQDSVGMVIKFLHVARLKSNRGYVESGQYIISF